MSTTWLSKVHDTHFTSRVEAFFHSKLVSTTTTRLRHILDAKMHKYDPLDRERKEIRLLILEPGSGDSILCCTLKHAFLDSSTPPRYETISYVCGDQTIKAPINLHSSEVEVPATSEAALRRMRRRDRPRTLWIDAICINEADIDERGHQVGIMFDIYSKTSHNCIYLGPEDSETPKVIESMEAILREISVETRGYVDFGMLLSGPSGNLKLSRTPVSPSIDQYCLIDFYQNRWFSRLWIVREASLSRVSTCYSGRFHVFLTDVLRIARWIRYKSAHVPWLSGAQAEGLRNAGTIFDAADRTYGRFYRHQTDFWNFLKGFRDLLTLDRRDKVYALIPLWQMHTQTLALHPTLKPDYTLSVSEIFTNVSKFAVQEMDDLSLLRDVYTSPFGKQNAPWPSWVPVLDIKRRPHRWDLPRLLSSLFTADNRSPARIFYPTPSTLDVAGMFIDEVTDATSAPTKALAGARDYIGFVASAERICSPSIGIKDSGGDLETRISLALQAGVALGDKRATDQEALQDYRNFKTFLHDDESPLFPGHLTVTSAASDEFKAADTYFTAVQDNVPHRAVFYTKNGQLGLGPGCTQPGDIVAVLYGCQWPVVMRPLPTPGEYKFLECAYVYGIMDGEAVRRHKEMGREDDKFVII
jgi:hypothetical protein